MTELQKQNIEHAERELATATSHVLKLIGEEHEQQVFIDSMERKLDGIKRDLAAAELKQEVARTRFLNVVSDITGLQFLKAS